MPKSQSEDDLSIVLKFGGGIDSSASEDEIDSRGCSTGENFSLDLRNRNLKNRPAIDLIGTAPNGEEVRGFTTLVQADGTATMLVQAGDTVYKFSVSGGFINVGTVDSLMKMRGHLHQYWPLDDKVIIADLNARDVVMEWDGGSLSDMSHNLVGDFKAKYIFVEDERARYANVISNSVTTEHMIVSSKLSDHDNLSTSDRPTSALGADDPYFLLTPDLRAINGIASAFGVMAVSSERGSMYKIEGQDTSDTSIGKLHPRSFASGDEAMIYSGNDIPYGRVGRIESILSTDRFGEVASDDLSVPIKDQIKDLKDWTIAYNPRTDKVYFHAAGKEFVWEYNKTLAGSGLSPWSKLTTSHSMSMNPSTMMMCVDPDDNLEYIFMGDGDGNVYRLEGTGADGDAGSNDIKMSWRSKLFRLPPKMSFNDFEGYVSYRSGTSETISIKFLFAGSEPSNDTATVPLQGTPGTQFWGGANYWGEDKYWGVPFEGRFRREELDANGNSEEFQIEVSYEGKGTIEINEIGLRFKGAS